MDIARYFRIVGHIIALALVIYIMASCRAAEQKTPLMVFAAASLTDVFLELEIEYEQHTNVDLEFNFGP